VRVARIGASSRVQSLPRTSPKTRSQQKKSWSEEDSPSPPQGILSPCFELPSSHQASGIRRLQGREIESLTQSISFIGVVKTGPLLLLRFDNLWPELFKEKINFLNLYINYCSEVKFCLVWIRKCTADFLSPTNCLFIVFAHQVSENNSILASILDLLWPIRDFQEQKNPSLRLKPIMGRRGEQLRIIKLFLARLPKTKR